jgi:hypothetical protein
LKKFELGNSKKRRFGSSKISKLGRNILKDFFLSRVDARLSGSLS